MSNMPLSSESWGIWKLNRYRWSLRNGPQWTRSLEDPFGNYVSISNDGPQNHAFPVGGGQRGKSDFNGRTFCITQAFFPDQDAWGKLAKALKGVVDPDAFAAFKGTTSLPFEAGEHRQVAVKVIDPRGNEVMTIHKLED